MLMKSIIRGVTLKPLTDLAAGIAASVFARQAEESGPVASPAVGGASDASPIFGVSVPTGYRQCELVAVSYETAFDEFRGILGDPLTIRAYGDATLPFPDGTILAKLAWKRVPSTEFNGAFVPEQPRPSNSWSRIGRNTPPRAGGDSADSLAVNQWTRRSTRPASPVIWPM